MCTVVVDWEPGRIGRVLALRDELVGRDFDDPGTWWADQPSAVGGRDRVAGGTWCATDYRTGRTALVLNRPQRPIAAAAAPSRGELPLAALAHGAAWPQHLELDGMASFALVTVDSDSLAVDEYDGTQLRRSTLQAGTHVITSGGAEDRKASKHLAAFAAGSDDESWLALVQQLPPSDDLSALVVRVEHNTSVYATVFGQLIHRAPGRLALSWSRTPWLTDGWLHRVWP